MRAFIAAPLPAQMTAPLRRLQQSLAAQVDAFRPMSWRNLHLTLLFLGDQPPAVLEECAELMLSVGVAAAPCEVPLARWGLWGRGERRRPFGLELAPCPELSELQRNLRGALLRHGLNLGQENYRPHLTLGRTLPPLPDAEILTPLLDSIQGPLRLEEIGLYSSHLHPKGAEHRLLAATQLLG